MIETLKSETVTVSTAAAGLGLTIPAGTTQVVLYFEGAIRYWTAGKPPTSTTGFLTTTGQTLTLQVTQATGLRMIRTGGADIAVQVEYQRDNQQRSTS